MWDIIHPISKILSENTGSGREGEEGKQCVLAGGGGSLGEQQRIALGTNRIVTASRALMSQARAVPST